MRPVFPAIVPPLLPPSEVSPQDIQAAVNCIPFPRGVRLALDSGVMRFAKTTPPRWRMWSRGKCRKPRPEVQAVLIDSSSRVAGVATIPPAETQNPAPPTFVVRGDMGWPVGLADAPSTATLLLVRGAEDAFAALELWGGVPGATVIAMLADHSLSSEALEVLRGRSVVLVDFGGADAGFVFGGWRAQLLDAGVFVLSTLIGSRSEAGGPLSNLNLSGALRFLTSPSMGGKFDLQTLANLIQQPCPPKPQ